MKKITILFFIISLFFLNPIFAKKQKPVLILTSKNPDITQAKYKDIEAQQYFLKNSKIYFVIYVPEGFKSDYIKYQIVKQQDKAHVGGFNRIRNVTLRVKNKNYHKDYFTLSEPGKYFIQIFDIQNLHHWLAISSFWVLDD